MFRKTNKIVFMIPLIFLGCGVHQAVVPSAEGLRQTEIVNGQKARPESAISKSVVAIVSQVANGQALCTGTILTEDAILTAAHCVDGDPQNIHLIFARDIHANAVSRPGVGFLQNSRWHQDSPLGQGDLAIILFAGGLPAGFEPVTLVPRGFRYQKNQSVLFLGYGVSTAADHTGSGILRETSSRIIGKKSATEIITDGKNSSVCFGDSGGPAFLEYNSIYVQWGVANSVTNENCNEASIHTSVTSYETWMNKSIDSLRKSIDPGFENQVISEKLRPRGLRDEVSANPDDVDSELSLFHE